MIKELVEGTTQLAALSSKLNHIKSTPSGFTARCPAHEDLHNSLSVSRGGDGRILLKCHAGCDTRDVLAALGMSFGDLFPPAGETSQSISRKTRTSSWAPAASSPSKPARREAAVYPYVDEAGALLYEVVRVVPKGFYQRRPDGAGGFVSGLGDARRVLYRLDLVTRAVAAGHTILLCEGEKDADAVNALARAAGGALPGPVCATTAPMGAGKWREEYTRTLAGSRVIVCPDNDGAGYAHLRACGEALRAAGCEVLSAEAARLDPALSERKGADVSDYLARSRDPAAALARLIREAEPFGGAGAFEGVAEYLLDGFQREAERAAKIPPLLTGIPALDAQLGGRLFPGLYVLGSLSGMGKTALAAQIALAVAGQGRKALFFSLEMSKAEMTARAVASLLFQKDAGRFGALRAGDLLCGSPVPAAELRALAALPALANLSFVQGDCQAGGMSAGRIAQRVREHLRAFGEAPAVIVDYLQLLAPPEGIMNDKQAVDGAVTALKRLSGECGAPVIAISSFNRQNYTAAASHQSFKESGAIEYSADVVLALQPRGARALSDRPDRDPAREIERLTANAMRKDIRPLELAILKNRRGAGHGLVDLDFYAGNFYFAVPH